MKKTCTKCSGEKEINLFHKKKRGKYGVHAWCKECCSEYGRIYRSRNKDKIKLSMKNWYTANKSKQIEKAKIWYGNNKEKRKTYIRKYMKEYFLLNNEAKKKRIARSILNRAVRDNKIIKRNSCEFCYDTKNIHGHHEDYSKPLEVIWMCRRCHDKLHLQYREQNIILT